MYQYHVVLCCVVMSSVVVCKMLEQKQDVCEYIDWLAQRISAKSGKVRNRKWSREVFNVQTQTILFAFCHIPSGSV